MWNFPETVATSWRKPVVPLLSLSSHSRLPQQFHLGRLKERHIGEHPFLNSQRFHTSQNILDNRVKTGVFRLGPQLALLI